jgi:hypothetical protein
MMSNIKRLYEHYGGMISSFQKFVLILDKVTNDYGCMVIQNSTGNIYWHKAEVHPDFKNYDFLKSIIPKPYNNIVELKKKIGEDCPICLDEMVDINDMSITKCLHAFHRSCYSGYKNKHECPCCRSATGL